MPNVIDYTEASQYDSFYDKDVNALDILALTEIAYLPFDHLVPADLSSHQHISLLHLARHFEEKLKKPLLPFTMITGNRLNLLSRLSQYKRYKHIKAFAFINDYSLDSQKQFAAIAYQIRPKEFVIVFRGTDDTLIGWKEDFHMTYMAEIPAQRSAAEYLTHMLSTIEGTFFIAGHSKGGNLATYAASQVPSALQEKIQKVYSFDAPGVHASVIQSPGFQAITKKLQPIIPQNSIVGMMLETPENALIVKSNAISLMQHVSFSWEIEGDQFKQVSSITDDSIQMDKTLKAWTASLSDEELKDFFDLFFGVFIEAGVLRFGDITIDTSSKIQKIIQNSQSMTTEQQAMMERLVRLLIDTRFQIWKEHLPDLPQLPDFKLQNYIPNSLQGALPDFRLQERFSKSSDTHTEKDES